MTSLRPSICAGQGGLGKALIQEARICFAEWLLKCALYIMPEQAPEAAPLAEALGGYADEAMRLNRWGSA